MGRSEGLTGLQNLVHVWPVTTRHHVSMTLRKAEQEKGRRSPWNPGPPSSSVSPTPAI